MSVRNPIEQKCTHDEGYAVRPRGGMCSRAVTRGRQAQERAALVLAATAAGTGAWSMLQVCFLDSASETFFLRRMSSRSGEERSGRKGTKTGLGPEELDLA